MSPLCPLVVVVVLTLAHVTHGLYGNRLNAFVRHYEALRYDATSLRAQHERARRSPGNTHQPLTLTFHALGRHFSLRLVRDASLFTEDFSVQEGAGEPQAYSPSHIYTGNIHGEEGSLVHASIDGGLIEGFILTRGAGTFYLDHAARHRPYAAATGSIIYHEGDLHYPHPYGSLGGCANHSVFHRMHSRQQQHAATEPTNTSTTSHHSSPPRLRRALGPEQKTCLLFIQTDHLFTQHYGSRDNVIAQIAGHVKALDAIYQNTNFNGIRGINFMVKRVRVNGTDEARDPTNPFRFPNIGVEKFLELSSEQNQDEFCLAYVFTDRDFDDGVLGLAWVAAPSGSSGGICERHRLYSDGRRKSLNTGIITVQNYGSAVPPKVSHITFAHEVGHNFGSPHDSGLACTPGASPSLALKEQGNYIMFARATSGDRVNNNRFSPCSVGNISAVLAAKRSCFTESGKPICGNALVELGEECDCGYSDQCQDRCCHHANSPEELRCRLRPNMACSPSQGPCCTETCTFLPGDSPCRPESECAFPGTCTGTAAGCPASEPKANHTACNNGTQVCINGQCSGSICERFGLEECSCSDTEDDREMCHLCCMQRGVAGSCVSSSSPQLAAHFNGTVIRLQPGAACSDFRGYCDAFSRCRPVDADGPLARLKKAIFNPELYQDIATWIRVYWWAVLLMLLALILLMAAFIRVCSVHTPTSNPKLPPHKHISDTLRRGRRRQGTGGATRPAQGPQQGPPQRPPQGPPPSKRGGGASEAVELQGRVR